MVSSNEKQTKEAARELVSSLKGPSVIALFGDLGSGKTTFVQGLAESLGIKKRVLSPTFVFIRSYKTQDKRFPLFHHVDLYRAETLDTARSTGIEEILSDNNTLVAIEWPEVIEQLLPDKAVKVRFKKISETEREIRID